MQPFKLIENRLVVAVDLDLDSEAQFKEASERLLAVERDTLYLDLSRVGFIGSAFFGQMFLMNYKIKKSGRNLILRVPARLLSIMELLGLPQLLEVEVVEDKVGSGNDEMIGEA